MGPPRVFGWPALVAFGAALRRAGRRERARAALAQGREGAHACGARALADHALAELCLAGARPRRIALSGRDALTPPERQVCVMAREGLGNRDIAQALFVTLRTVETHLGSAYRKLGILGRPELGVALAAEAGPEPLLYPRAR